jgi:O-antigen/teichoic acid export membrane protein
MTMGLFGLLGLGAILAVDPLLHFVGIPVYAEHKELLWPILLMAGVLAFAEIPQTVLYARHRDRALIGTAWLGLATAVILSVLLVPSRGLMGAAVATLLASIVVAIARVALSVRSA